MSARCTLGHKACKPEIGRGDVVMFGGNPHLIARIDPYEGPHDFVTGIARAADGWGISLTGGCMEVAEL